MIFNKRISLVSTAFCLVCFFAAGTLFAADTPEEIVDVNFAPGQEFRADVNSKIVGIDHFMVYVPSDYNDERDWPVIFFYHGMGGQPTTELFRQITGGRGFIIVGMGYVPGGESPMNEGQYVNYIKRLKKSVLEVKRYLSKNLKIDEKQFFVTGCSKGGWHTAALLESGPKIWAGAVILAAGRLQAVNLLSTVVNKKALRGKPVYIGAGEKDVNLDPADKAAVYYKRLGAVVTFERFQGQGHICYPPNPEKLYNWLIANSSVDGTQSGKTDLGVR
jgi:predicted esterase